MVWLIQQIYGLLDEVECYTIKQIYSYSKKKLHVEVIINLCIESKRIFGYFLIIFSIGFIREKIIFDQQLPRYNIKLLDTISNFT